MPIIKCIFLFILESHNGAGRRYPRILEEFKIDLSLTIKIKTIY